MTSFPGRYDDLSSRVIAKSCSCKSNDLIRATENLIVLMNSKVEGEEVEPTCAVSAPLIKVQLSGMHAMLTCIRDDVDELAERLEESE